MYAAAFCIGHLNQSLLPVDALNFCPVFDPLALGPTLSRDDQCLTISGSLRAKDTLALRIYCH